MAVGARLGEANVLTAQGDVLAFQDRRDEALAKYEQALGLFRGVGARLGEANTLLSLAGIAHATGRLDDAWHNHAEACALYQAVGSPYSLGRAWLLRGDWHVDHEQRPEAAQAYQFALQSWRKVEQLEAMIQAYLLPRLQAVEDPVDGSDEQPS